MVEMRESPLPQSLLTQCSDDPGIALVGRKVNGRALWDEAKARAGRDGVL
jgi:hypothetical protein